MNNFCSNVISFFLFFDNKQPNNLNCHRIEKKSKRILTTQKYTEKKIKNGKQQNTKYKRQGEIWAREQKQQQHKKINLPESKQNWTKKQKKNFISILLICWCILLLFLVLWFYGAFTWKQFNNKKNSNSYQTIINVYVKFFVHFYNMNIVYREFIIWKWGFEIQNI